MNQQDFMAQNPQIFIESDDLPPENDTRYNLIKGGINGQKRIHTGANHQDDMVTISESSTGMVPVISMFSPSNHTLIPSISTA